MDYLKKDSRVVGRRWLPSKSERIKNARFIYRTIHQITQQSCIYPCVGRTALEALKNSWVTYKNSVNRRFLHYWRHGDFRFLPLKWLD